MTDIADVRKAIEQGDDIFGMRVKAGDAAGLAALYTSTAMLLPPGSQPVTGHSNIEAFWRSVMDMGIKEANLQTLEVEAFGDTAIEVGTYVLRVEGGQTADQGKYIVVWKREGGAWKLHRDVWNTSVTPAKV